MAHTKVKAGDVDVYYNLHKRGWSVRSRVSGKVMDVVQSIALTDVRFVVQPAGREKVRREKKKTVHAFCRGTLTHINDIPFTELWPVAIITYNPYKNETFINKDTGVPVEQAKWVYLNDHREVFAFGNEDGIVV